jgi:hypothetical protein
MEIPGTAARMRCKGISTLSLENLLTEPGESRLGVPKPERRRQIMQTRSIAPLPTKFLVLVLISAVSAWAGDSNVGTWKLNIAKSTYSPGPAPKSSTITIVAVDDGIQFKADGIDAAGEPTHVEYTAKYDGQDNPVTGIGYADTVAVKRIDANTIETTLKKAGTPVMTVRATVSPDGKTRAAVFTGKNEKGQDVHNIAVYDKQ